MIKVVVGGAAGRLGRSVCNLVEQQEDMQLHGAVEYMGSKDVGKEIAKGVKIVGSDQLQIALEGADVYVDATTAEAASHNLPVVAELGVNAVVATTGISQETITQFQEEVRRNGTSAVISPNFSVGVNVFWKICQEMARALQGYDIEIVEVHHNKKRDSPSGTAKKAAEMISEVTGIDKIVYGREGNVGPRGREIGGHSIRAGDVVGQHTVIFAGKKETLELTHTAFSREVFTEGIITTIRWVAGKKDGLIHSMSEVLGL